MFVDQVATRLSFITLKQAYGESLSTRCVDSRRVVGLSRYAQLVNKMCSRQRFYELVSSLHARLWMFISSTTYRWSHFITSSAIRETTVDVSQETILFFRNDMHDKIAASCRSCAPMCKGQQIVPFWVLCVRNARLVTVRVERFYRVNFTLYLV